MSRRPGPLRRASHSTWPTAALRWRSLRRRRVERANPNLRGEIDSAILLARAAGLAAARLAEIDLASAGAGYDEEHARLEAVRVRLSSVG